MQPLTSRTLCTAAAAHRLLRRTVGIAPAAGPPGLTVSTTRRPERARYRNLKGPVSRAADPMCQSQFAVRLGGVAGRAPPQAGGRALLISALRLFLSATAGRARMRARAAGAAGSSCSTLVAARADAGPRPRPGHGPSGKPRPKPPPAHAPRSIPIRAAAAAPLPRAAMPGRRQRARRAAVR